MRFGRALFLLSLCLQSRAAQCDGLTPIQLQNQFQSGPSGSPAAQEQARAKSAESAIASTASSALALASGAVQSAGGTISNTLLLPGAIGATNLRSLSARAGERVSVGDYAAAGSGVGGGLILNVLQPQSAGDRTVVVGSVAGLAAGELVTSPFLAVGTRIASVGSAATTLVSKTTTATTSTEAELEALIPTPGVSNALTFSTVFGLPVGATVTGPDVAAGTTVVGTSYPSTGGTIVSLSAGVTADLVAGTAISFGYSAVALTLTAGWSGAVPAGIQVGAVTQDDWPAFQNAAYLLAPERGGPGGTIWVPSGTYYLSQNANTYNGVSYEFGSNVRLVPGSASTDVVPLGITDNTNLTIAGSARNPVATSLVVAQNMFQQPQRTLQDQALLVTQNNVNCTNDGGGNGCGMVGAEVKQGIAAALHRGILWAYHSTDDAQAGQSIAYAGAELELRNNTGIDWMWNSTFGNKTGLHIDDLGNTANTVALMAGGNAPTGGGWHRSMDCNHITILDYCFDIQDGPLSGTGLEPVIVAGLDMTGRYLGTGLSIYAQASASNRTLASTGAAIDSSGNLGALSLSTQTITSQTGSVASVAVQNGGATDTPYTLTVQPPASGTAATVAATGYALRVLQGFGPTNSPAGMVNGDVYTIPGGTCTTQPQVTYNAGSWSVSTAGQCSVPPVGTQLAPITATGGSATTAPQFWPMWQLTGVTVTAGGAGYNPAIPPVVQALTTGSAIVVPRLVPTLSAVAAPLRIQSGAIPALTIAATGAVAAPNGFSAATIQASGSLIQAPSSTGYVLQQSDCGTTLEPQPSAPMSISVPTTLALGCKVEIIQVNAQSIGFAGQSGMTMRALGAATKLSGLYGKAIILVDSASTFSLSGNIQ